MPARYIALDIHKHYFVAAGITPGQEQVLRTRRVPNDKLNNWINEHLTDENAVVLEMTTNTYAFHDALKPHVHSVTVVHPPHVALITRAQVKTDHKDALALARLHAAGLLPGVWIPPQEVRDLRTLVAQRRKMSRLAALAKNRLHSLLHRHGLKPPPGSQPFLEKHADFWLDLPVSVVEQVTAQCDWETVRFAEKQKERLEEAIRQEAARDERVPLLVQIPGIGLLSAVTLLAAIGDIERFPTARQLVGYAGLGARVHMSGQKHTTGRITKAGRKDIRYTMVVAAQHAARTHPHWQAEFKRLAKRMDRRKAKVAIARKLLVGVWHVLNGDRGDRFADPVKVACSLFKLAYDIRVRNLPRDMSALAYTRYHLDRLGLGETVTEIPWGSKTYKLPPLEVGSG